MGKYWFLLTEDPVLSHYVSDTPNITYRRAPSLKDQLVWIHFCYKTQSKPSLYPAITPCSTYEICSHIDTRIQAELPNNIKWKRRANISCRTMGIIYLLTYSCGLFYVGKTKRPIRVRISEHLKAARTGFFKTIIGRHHAFVHNFDFGGFKVLPLIHIPPHERGGDWDQALLKTESRWIYKLKATKEPGMNDALSYVPFLPRT